MGFFECVLEEERMLGEHSLRKTRLETDHYRAENERLSIENERLALENERMKIELVRVPLKFRADNLARLLPLFFHISLADRPENSLDDEGLSVHDLQRVNHIFPVLKGREAPLFHQNLDVCSIQFFHGNGVGIFKHPFITRGYPFGDKIHLGEPQSQFRSLLFPLLRIYPEGLPDKRGVDFREISQKNGGSRRHGHFPTSYHMTQTPVNVISSQAGKFSGPKRGYQIVSTSLYWPIFRSLLTRGIFR